MPFALRNFARCSSFYYVVLSLPATDPGVTMFTALLRSSLPLTVCLLLGGNLAAQEPEKPKLPPRPADLKPLPPPAEQPAQPVSPEQVREQAEEKLAAIAGKMQAVEHKLAKQDTGQPTQADQQEIIKRLDELIQLAEQAQQNPPPPQPNQNPQENPEQNPENQPQQNPEQQPMPEQQPQPQPQGQQQPEPQPQEQPMETEGDGSNGPRKQDDNAAESTENVEQRNARQKQAEEAARQNRINAVWGHLPPGIRQKIMNASSEKSLPQYEELNRKYRDSLIKSDQ